MKSSVDEINPNCKANDTPVIAQCYSTESRCHIGISEVFGLNQWKYTPPEAPLVAQAPPSERDGQGAAAEEIPSTTGTVRQRKY